MVRRCGPFKNFLNLLKLISKISSDLNLSKFSGIAADPPDQMKTVCDLRKKLLGDGDKKYDKLSKPTKDHKTRIELLMMVHLFQIVDLVRYI